MKHLGGGQLLAQRTDCNPEGKVSLSERESRNHLKFLGLIYEADTALAKHILLPVLCFVSVSQVCSVSWPPATVDLFVCVCVCDIALCLPDDGGFKDSVYRVLEFVCACQSATISGCAWLLLLTKRFKYVRTPALSKLMSTIQGQISTQPEPQRFQIDLTGSGGYLRCWLRCTAGGEGHGADLNLHLKGSLVHHIFWPRTQSHTLVSLNKLCWSSAVSLAVLLQLIISASPALPPWLFTSRGQFAYLAAYWFPHTFPSISFLFSSNCSAQLVFITFLYCPFCFRRFQHICVPQGFYFPVIAQSAFSAPAIYNSFFSHVALH
ncbi:hypothetical protein INR49_010560 [Caranx melampygus]|nr:hypothetical protein INR49_010560 [Caranx melampygus]